MSAEKKLFGCQIHSPAMEGYSAIATAVVLSFSTGFVIAVGRPYSHPDQTLIES